MSWKSSFTAKAFAASDLAAHAAWSHPDRAASRAYYAVVAGMNARLGPPDPGRVRRHGDLRFWTTLRALGLGPGDRRTIYWLYLQRVKADYREDAVGSALAARSADAAARILGRMGLSPP